MRLNGGQANLTQCSFADSFIGLGTGNGANAELHSCAFERDGGNDTNGAVIIAIGAKTSSDKTNIYKEHGAIVQTDGMADNSSQASPEPSGSPEQSHRKGIDAELPIQ